MGYYTTHDHGRPVGKRCRVHDDVTNNIIIEAEGHFVFLGAHYYMTHNPSREPRYQCVVYAAVEIVDSSGNPAWAPTGSPLVTGR